MRDTRFDRDDNSARRFHALEQGRLVETDDDAAATVAALRTWYIGTIQSTTIGDPESLVLVPDGALRSALFGLPHDRAAALLDWLTHFSAVEGDVAADWLWGTALAEAAMVLTQNRPAFEHTWRIAGWRPAARAAYLNGLASALGRPDGALVWTMMDAIMERVRTLAGCWAPRDNRERFAEALPRWRETACLPNVWNTRNLEHYGVSCDESWLLDALRRHNRERYLHLLEETSNPLVIQYAFDQPEVAEDSDEILALIQAAASITSQAEAQSLAGEWNKRLVAPLLLQAVLKHAQQLHRILLRSGASSQEIDKLLIRDVPSLVQRLMDVLLTRDDGQFLVLVWMLYLAHQLAHTQWQLSALSSIFRAVAEALADQRIGEEDFLGVMLQCSEGMNGVDVLLCCVAISDLRSSEESAVTEENARLAAAMERLLNHGDAGLSPNTDISIPSWCHIYAAVPFLREPDPVQAWATAWQQLSEQRRRILHSAYSRDLAADEPSLFLVYVGVATLHLLCGNTMPTSGQVALDLWQRLFDASLSVILRVGSWFQWWHRAETWRSVIVLLFSRLPLVVHYVGDDMTSERLSALLHRLGGDDELLLLGVVTLRHEDIPAACLSDALIGIGADLTAIIERYAAFIDRGTRPIPTRASNLLEKSRALAREL